MNQLSKILLFILIVTSCKSKDLSTDCNITVIDSNGIKQISIPVIITKSDNNSLILHSGRTNSQGVFSFVFDEFQVVNVNAKRIDTAIFSGNGELELDSLCAGKIISLEPEKTIFETLELRPCSI